MLLFYSCKKKDSGSGSSGTLSENWEQTKGPNNGLIRCIALNGNIIYAGSTGEGIFVSNDFGSTWSHINLIMSSMYPFEIVTHNDTVIACCQNFYRSTDKGKTWIKLSEDLKFTDIKSVTWIGNRILVCDLYTSHLFYSDDGGQNWNQIPGSLPDNNLTGGTTLGSDFYITSSINGIYKSSDNGQTFVLSNNGLTDAHVTCIKTSGDKLYAGTDNGLYVSSDHAATWNLISNIQMNGRNLIRLAIEGSVIMAGSDNGLFISRDGGVTWTEADNGLPDKYIESVTLQGSTYFAGTNCGIYISINGGTVWKATGLPDTHVNFLSSNGTDVFSCAGEMTGGVGVYISKDLGSTWFQMNTGFPSVITVISVEVNGSCIYAGTAGHGVWRHSL
jgi:photosystem II stability/assembly factor-like uncharacterized protein